MARLNLPCLRGRIGDWTYFSTVMKVKDIVDNNRIITVAESQDLYSDNINEILQRDLKKTRISKIATYLNNNDERFFNSLVVAIHKGDPKWSDIDLNEEITIEGKSLAEEEMEFIENKFGILTLSGDEVIFALDGQHRLMGLRKAIEKNPKIGDEEISLVYVIHNQENKERTRRMFTVLNKYAEKPRGAELIILDEDDAAAIVTRRLVENHPVLSLPSAISDSKTANLPPNDFNSFTTLVAVNKVNKILYKRNKDFYTKRPSEEHIDKLHDVSVQFWDMLFNIFPEIVSYIDGDRNIYIDNNLFDRNSDTGGSLLLRPVGQEYLAHLYKYCEDNSSLDVLIQKLRKIDFNLSGNNFNYLFWQSGKMIGRESKLKKEIFKFLIGQFTDNQYINKEMNRIYSNYNLEYNSEIVPVD